MEAAVISFQRQHELLGTLWTDEQEEALAGEVRAALENEFGATVVEEKLPLQHAVGWLSDDNEFAIENRREPTLEDLGALRVCLCLHCGQRIVWKPAFGAQACSSPCAHRVHAEQWHARVRQTREKLRQARLARETAPTRPFPEPRPAIAAARPTSYAVLQPDPIALGRIASDLRHQFREAHNTETIFLGTRLVAAEWVVMEFAVVNGNGGVIRIVLNGSGPGRAAWTPISVSAEHAVALVVGGDLLAARTHIPPFSSEQASAPKRS